jgi:hypothetical protein
VIPIKNKKNILNEITSVLPKCLTSVWSNINSLQNTKRKSELKWSEFQYSESTAPDRNLPGRQRESSVATIRIRRRFRRGRTNSLPRWRRRLNGRRRWAISDRTFSVSEILEFGRSRDRMNGPKSAGYENWCYSTKYAA